MLMFEYKLKSVSLYTKYSHFYEENTTADDYCYIYYDFSIDHLKGV